MFQLKLEQLFLNMSYTFVGMLDFATLRDSGWIHFILSSCFSNYVNNKSTLVQGGHRSTQISTINKELYMFICSCLNKFNAQEFAFEVKKIK